AVCDPRGMGPGTYTAEIDITSGDATNSPLVIPVTLVVARYPFRAPEISSMSNAASMEVGAISPGELVRITGANLECATGPSVLVDGEMATVVSTGGRDMTAVAPAGLGRKLRVDIRVGCGAVLSDPFSVPVSYASPGLFTVEKGKALAFNED